MDFHLLAYSIILENDTPSFNEGMDGPYLEQYYEAIQEELDTLVKMDVFDVITQSEAEGRIILDSTWAYKVYRYL